MPPVGLKLLGACLVIAAGAGLGFTVAGRYVRRPRELAALRVALQVLLTEIDYGLTPLPQALHRAASAAGGAVADLLSGVGRQLAERRGITPPEAVGAMLGQVDLAFTDGDRSVLLALAAALGASDRRDQDRHITLALRRLELAEAEARREGERCQRLARSLGVLGAIALVLLVV